MRGRATGGVPSRGGSRAAASAVIAAAIAVALAGGVASPPAARAEIVLEIAPAISVGATNNPQGATQGAQQQGDGFATGSATARARYTGARATHALGYQLAYTRFFQERGPNTVTNALTATSMLRLTAALQVGLIASATLSRVSRVDVTDLTLIMPGAVVGGTTLYLGTSVGQNVVYEPNPKMRVTESFTVAQVRYLDDAATPVARPTTTVLTGDFGGSRMQGRDIWSLDLRAADSYTPSIPMVPDTFATGNTFIVHLLAGWKREFTAVWAGQLQAGPVVMFKLDGTTLIAPAGLVTVLYQQRPWYGTLSFGQTAAPNLYLGQATLNLQSLARMALPLNRSETMFAAGFGGYSFARVAQEVGGFRPAFDQATAGLSLNVRLQSAPFGGAIQYTFVRQRTFADDPGMPLSGFPAADLQRHTVMLTFGGLLAWGPGTMPLFGGGP